jgi:hypothetical protein
MDKPHVVVMGSYVTDLAFRTEKLPAWGETFMGSGFQMGPGGKGSNQAAAASRAGARVSFISKLGHDPLGDLARQHYVSEGIDASHVYSTASATGAAAIIIDAARGAVFAFRSTTALLLTVSMPPSMIGVDRSNAPPITMAAQGICGLKAGLETRLMVITRLTVPVVVVAPEAGAAALRTV